MRFAAIGYLIGIAAAQDQTGQITGSVVDAATRQPVKKATVNLNFLTVAGHANQAASTDATGAFSFDGLPEGRYLLTATHQNYPQGSRQTRKSVEIKAGEHAGSISLELTPGAVITGHVFDEDGDPLPGCYVQANVPANPNQPGGGSNDNQEGDYRIHDLPPGKYVISAHCNYPAFTPRPFSAGPNPPVSLAYPVQYYPLAPDPKSAQAIDLAPGVEKPGVDFRLRPMPVTQVRGVISGGADLRPDNGLRIRLVPIDRWGPGEMDPPFDPQKGTFECQWVFPGSYYLVATSNGDASTRASGFERIDVKDRPVETMLTLARGADLAGTLTVDGDNSGNQVPLTQIQIRLGQDQLFGGDMNVAQVTGDGAFVIKSVLPSRYRVYVNGPQVYLKSAWLGNTDVTHTTFEVSAGSEALRIVVSANLGTISGTAPAGEMVYAVTDDLVFRTAQADQAGRFTLPQVPPGKYRVGLTGGPGMPLPEEGGQEVTVHEGETVTVDVKQN